MGVNGEPIATTNSPGLILAEQPSFITAYRSANTRVANRDTHLELLALAKEVHRVHGMRDQGDAIFKLLHAHATTTTATAYWRLANSNDSSGPFMILPLIIIDLFLGSKDSGLSIECVTDLVCLTAIQKKLATNINAAIDDWLSAKDNKETKKFMKKHADIIIFINLKILFTDENLVDVNTTNWVPMYLSGPLGNLITGSQFAQYFCLYIQIVQVTILSVLLCIADCFFFNIMIHLTGQLEEFVGSMNRHSELMELYENLEDSFHFLIYVISTCGNDSYMLALIGLRLNIYLNEKNYVEATKSVLVLNYLLMQSLVYIPMVVNFCKKKSESIFHALYTTSWFTLSLALMKDLYFAMMRSNIPFRLTGGKFFFVNRETMMYIFKTSASYICVLQESHETEGFLLLLSLEMNDTITAAKHGVFIVALLVQIFLCCFAGQTLEFQSEGLAYAIYKSPWYTFDLRIRKNLPLIILRAANPQKLTAGKFVAINLTTFMNILKASVSYLSVLRFMILPLLIMDLFWGSKDAGSNIECVTYLVSTTIAIIKGLCLTANQKKLATNINAAIDDWLSVKDNKETKKIIKKHADISRILTLALLYSLFFCCGAFISVVIFIKSEDIIHGREFRLRLNIYLNEKNYVEATKSVLVLNYFINAIVGIYTYGGEFLQKESESIFHALYTTSWFRLPLALMKDLYFAMMRLSFLLLLSLEMNDTITAAKHGVFIVALLVQIFLYCFAGQTLEFQSQGLAYAIYKSPWYTFDLIIMKNLPLIILRAANSQKLTAGKFVAINLTTFTNILKASVSYLSVLRVVQAMILSILLCIADCFFFNITIHLTGQLELLKNKFKTFANEPDSKANYRKKFVGLINIAGTANGS
ncbi:hypothetical protein DBV15_09075 [Temnothorax longispinosus]|uniref:Odorant receptor 13a n=1 Tax=Temnothorax longispinosus TaxID=300112 RepID=A0A4S2JFT4_9HYME|nr:hypothetical protein DBV15_09075 [Temnothorax longispinosus]